MQTTRHTLSRGFTALVAVLVVNAGAAAAPLPQGPALKTFKAGDTARASDVNDNFSLIDGKANANAAAAATNAAQVGQAAKDVATNKTAIAANAAAAATNKGKIDTNATGVATNRTGVAANKTRIDKNVQDIAANKTRIDNWNPTNLTGRNIVDNSLEARDIKPSILSSLNGVSNDGGNVDLVAGTSNVAIETDRAKRQVKISSKWVDFHGEANKAPVLRLLSNKIDSYGTGKGVLTVESAGNRAIYAEAGIAIPHRADAIGVETKAQARTQLRAYGVKTVAISDAKEAWGGYVESSSRSGRAYGLFGNAHSNTSNAYGVRGRASQALGNRSFAAGIYGESVLASPSKYGVYSKGDMGATGKKPFIHPHPTEPGKVVEFVCLEGNESGTYFRGKAELVGGVASIDIPEEWQHVTAEDGLTVHLTAIRSFGRLAVWEMTRERITVRGEEDCEFSYIVHGVRRGYEQHRPTRANSDFKPEVAGIPYGTQYPAAYRSLLVENGILNRDYTPNLDTARRLGWTLREPTPDEIQEAVRLEAAWRQIQVEEIAAAGQRQR